MTKSPGVTFDNGLIFEKNELKYKRKKGHVVYLISEVSSKVGCMMMVMVFKSDIIRVWQKNRIR